MPTIVIGNNTGDNYSGCNDNQIDNNDPTANNSSSTNMAVGSNGGAELWNTLIRFSGIPSVSGASVSATSINVYREDGHWSNPTFTIYARRLLRDWANASSCWSYYTGTTAWSTIGALSSGNDIAADNSISTSVASTTGYKSWSGTQLSTDTQNIMTGTNSNYGNNLTGIGTDTAYHVFTSSEGADGSRPYQSITYTAGGSPVFVPNVMFIM